MHVIAHVKCQQRISCAVFDQVAESKYASLQQHCMGLEREVAEVREELKEARQRLKGVEKEAESREGASASHNAEICSMRKQVTST